MRTYRQLLALVALEQGHPKQEPSPATVETGVIAPFPGYELLKSPFPEFAFSLGGDLVIVKQWLIKNPVCERWSKD